MCSSLMRGSPRSSSLRKNSNNGLSKTKPSSVPKRLQIDPDALFLITHSIGNISNLYTSESVLSIISIRCVSTPFSLR